MVKYFILFVFLALPPFSFAQNYDLKMQVKLQKEFSFDLTKAPFFLRFAYYKEFNKDWKTTDYAERYGFLADYETKSAAEQAKEKEEARAAAVLEKERLREKKEELLKEKELLKAQLAEQKAQQQEDEERQKAFDEAVQEQERELQQMRQQASQGN